VEGAVEVDQEVEERIVGPRLAGQVEGIVRVGHVLQREVALQPHRQAMEHDRVLQLLGQVLGLDQLGLGVGKDGLGQIETRRHEAKEALVAGALALVAQHLEQEAAVFIGQRLPLVEVVARPARPAFEARQRVALRVHAAPERPQLGAAAPLGVLDDARLLI